MERKMHFMPSHYVLHELSLKEIQDAFGDYLQLYLDGKIPNIHTSTFQKDIINLYMNQVDAVEFISNYGIKIKLSTPLGIFTFAIRSDDCEKNEIYFS